MLKTPDITPAQIVALVGAVLGLLVAFGIDLTKAQQDGIVLVVGLVSSALIVGDAHVRNGRAQIAAAKVARGEQ